MLLQVVKREIGRGSFGCVALGSWRDTDVAIKMLENGSLEGGKYTPSVLRSTLEKEVRSSLHHLSLSAFSLRDGRGGCSCT